MWKIQLALRQMPGRRAAIANSKENFRPLTNPGSLCGPTVDHKSWFLGLLAYLRNLGCCDILSFPTVVAARLHSALHAHDDGFKNDSLFLSCIIQV